MFIFPDNLDISINYVFFIYIFFFININIISNDECFKLHIYSRLIISLNFIGIEFFFVCEKQIIRFLAKRQIHNCMELFCTGNFALSSIHILVRNNSLYTKKHLMKFTWFRFFFERRIIPKDKFKLLIFRLLIYKNYKIYIL